MSTGGRIACVFVPALPLQLLVARHPEWGAHPVAVVDEDRPRGTVLWVDDAARRARVLPGMRYAAGLSRCHDLRAGVVTSAEIRAGEEGIVALLREFTPGVEPADEEAGVFWLDAAGLERLEPSLERWAGRIRDRLREEGLVARVAVGFTRFGTYALSRGSGGRPAGGDGDGGAGEPGGGSRRAAGRARREEARRRDGVRVLEDREEERRRSLRVSLDRLHLDPELRESLERLGVDTVGAFLKLPRDGLGRRFGQEALELHLRAGDALREPLDPEPPPRPVEAVEELGYREPDATRLLFRLKRRLHPLLAELAERGEALARLSLDLRLDDGSRRTEEIAPAAPTLEAGVIVDLLRLRLEAVDLSAGVVEAGLRVEGRRVDAGQLALFRQEPKRDLDAANRALARLRAELGPEAVVRARLRRAHLPEARFSWEPMRETVRPDPRPRSGRRNPGSDGGKSERSGGEGIEQPGGEDVGGPSGEGAGGPNGEAAGGPDPTLVRRIYESPRMLPPRGRHEPDGWLIRGLEQGPAVRMQGPYVISGGWWVREVHREYHFVEARRGDLLWVFYDRHRRRWFQHGDVE